MLLLVQASSCSFDSTPSLGTYICHWCSPKKTKKKKKKERKKKGIRVCTLERARSQTKFADTRKKMAKEKEAIFGDKKQVLSSV